MNVQTHFRHMHLDPNFEGQVKAWMSDKLTHGGRPDNLTVNIFVSASAPRTDTHGPLFECHVTVTAPGLPRKIFAKGSHTDFWTALLNCSHPIQHQLDKQRTIRHARRRTPKPWMMDMAA